MGKASEIWKEVKPKIGEMIREINDMESRCEKAQEEAYQRGYETAKHECDDCSKQAYTDALRTESYQKGLSDAWEAARKIWQYDSHLRIFKVPMRMDCFTKFSASEAIEKIRQYEQEQEEQIQVGDEIEAVSGKAVVVYVDDVADHKVRYVYGNGVYAFNYIDKVTKTGRHFPEIAAVLKKMRGEQDGKRREE